MIVMVIGILNIANKNTEKKLFHINWTGCLQLCLHIICLHTWDGITKYPVRVLQITDWVRVLQITDWVRVLQITDWVSPCFPNHGLSPRFPSPVQSSRCFTTCQGYGLYPSEYNFKYSTWLQSASSYHGKSQTNYAVHTFCDFKHRVI